MIPDADRGTGRQAQLNAIKLRALARPLVDAAPAEPAVFGGGAALLVGDRAVVLVDEPAHVGDGRGLGAALIWARRRGAERLDVLTEHGAAVMARRATEFALPTTVWAVDGASIAAATPAPVDPRSAAVPPSSHLEYLSVIEAAGATARIESGAAIGEVKGLEVCRIVGDDHDVRIEVGIGAHDREVFAMVHGDVPTPDSLRRVVDAVAAVRGHEPNHPLTTLAAERLLRWELLADPSPLGLGVLTPAEPPLPRVNLRDPTPCVATGSRPGDGAKVLVVISTGVDLDVIPYAADARLAGGLDEAEVLVVVPARDLVPATSDLAALVRRPVTLVPLPTR